MGKLEGMVAVVTGGSSGMALASAKRFVEGAYVFIMGRRQEALDEAVKLGEITEQHFDTAFGLNTRGTLFTVQKALPPFNDGGSIFTGTERFR